MIKKSSIAFLHPDLGLGGAERLVVDAAVELADRGHQVRSNVAVYLPALAPPMLTAQRAVQVVVYTAFHDPHRSFKETVDGPFTVTICGGWFPCSLFGRALAFCAYVRCILVACHIAWTAFRSANADHSTASFKHGHMVQNHGQLLHNIHMPQEETAV